MPAGRKDALVETATEMFHRNGFHATGIDRILAEAGIAKMTLYKHFRSKEELIVAGLERRSEEYRTWLRTGVEERARSAKKRLLAVFDLVAESLTKDGDRGCIFVNACAEYGDRSHPVHQAAAAHKAAVHSYFQELAQTAGAVDATALADQVMLLTEGATAIGQVSGPEAATRHLRKAAKQLIKHAGI
jgi:AcrR family transcriptional regulator